MAKYCRFKFSLYLVRDGQDLEISSVNLNMEQPNQDDRLEAWQHMIVQHQLYMHDDQYGYIKVSHFGFVLPVMDKPSLLNHLTNVLNLKRDYFGKLHNVYFINKYLN